MTWHPDIPEEYRNQIVTGDARELAKRIPDESIGLVVCDPVYWNTEDYGWIALESERILVVGGSLIVQCGAAYLDKIMVSMLESRLDFVWTLCEELNHGNARLWQLRIMQAWKPYLWFSKGKHTGAWIRDRLRPKPIKQYHQWGDGWQTFYTIINQLSPAGGLVFDPFTGGGTVPAVCKILGRNYIAFEIDPETADLARERVLNTQPPLFVPEPEQLELP